jgi:ferrochelatase
MPEPTPPELPARSALLLLNLGTPDAPNAAALRRYLAEFLADPRVIELPRIVWLPILYGAILPFRAPRSAAAYRRIWTPEGSPLRVESERLTAAVQTELTARDAQVTVRLAMRYGSPSIASVLRELRSQGLRHVLVLPLYPQFSATSTATALDAVMAELQTWRWAPELRTIADYHHEAAWLDAVAGSIRRHWQKHERGQRLLLSFHGIPQRYVDAGDPYFEQCRASAHGIAQRLSLSDSEWQMCFQSRVGRERWLQPYTQQLLESLPAQGVKRIDVVCPGFAVDCLETLEEIAMEGREEFIAAGGESLSYIPALNSDAAHVAMLTELALRHGAGWCDFDADTGVSRA